MTNKNNTYQLFGPSGCLTLETLKRCRLKTLTPEELKMLEEHIAVCEFCSDAMEGIHLVSDKDKLESIVSEINENLKNGLQNQEISVKSKILSIQNRTLYIAAAASVIILVGLFSYFQLFMSQPQQSDMAIEMNPVEEIPLPTDENYIIIEEDLELEEEQISPPVKKTVKKVESQKNEKSATHDKKQIDGKGEVYQPPLNKMKTTDSGTEAFYGNEAGSKNMPVEAMENESVDIASTLPVEYYLTGITISEKATMNMHIAQSASKQEEEPAINGVSLKSVQSSRVENRSEGKGIQSIDSYSYQADAESEEKEKHVEQMSNEIHFFDAVGQKPEFPGGEAGLIKYLQENLKYPSGAKKQSIQGSVLVSFMVEENGKVSDVKILRGIGGGCDEETARVISEMPSWKPAEKDGKSERVLFKMPIAFCLY